MTRTVAGWILAGFLGAVASAQQPKPRFEVASVKPSGPVTPSGGTWTDVMNSVGLRRLPDGITARQETVHSLIISAYGVLPSQIVGGPDWVKSDRFEITAKAGADVPVAQIQLMMQSLLEDRFKLVAHREQREMRHQALVLAKADRRLGPGLFRMDVACTPMAVNELRRQFPEKYLSPLGNGLISSCSNRGVNTLAASLASDLETPVIDATGLEGPFYWAFSAEWPRRSSNPGSNLGSPLRDPSDLPALSTAFEEQLGLKLESRKGPIEVLVIDSVSRPTGN
jgi:uncharacterized protein (TIGR03435 family)